MTLALSITVLVVWFAWVLYRAGKFLLSRDEEAIANYLELVHREELDEDRD